MKHNLYMLKGNLPNGEPIEEILRSKTNRTGKVVSQVESALHHKYGIVLQELTDVTISKIIR